MTTLSLSTPSVTHLLSMSAPIGSLATAIDPASDFPIDGAVSATHPVDYFSVTLSEPALVVLRVQEANTASRCALFLSCTTAKPNANSASWRLISPEPVKQLVLHPADPAYRVGVLTIAVHYLEASGQSSFQLRAAVRRDFFAMWLRTGEVPRGPFLSDRSAQGQLVGSPVHATTSAALASTLHGVLAGSAGGAGAVPAAATSSSAAASAAASSSATAHVRGALFTSLYIGDWHGSQREGLGFQYYAAPDDAVGGGDGGAGWTSAVQLDGSEDEEDDNSAASTGAEEHQRSSAPSLDFSPQQSGLPSATGRAEHNSLFTRSRHNNNGGSAADPLRLLRAFSERHNLPWSAWSIPDTLTPEELAKLGFGHSFRLAGSSRLAGAAGKGPKSQQQQQQEQQQSRQGESSGAERASASPITFQSPTTSSYIAAPGNPASSSAASATTTPPVPPSPVVASRATAVEGLSVLGGVIDRLLLAEIRDAELGQWSVLPVQPGVEVYAGEWVANRKDGRGFYQWLDRSYVGEWVCGRREGFGLLRRRDGGWYRGQWERHVPHGTGEARLMPENLIYKGAWRHGCRSGEGCLTYPDGTAVHGTWVADVLLPAVHVVYPDGSTYDGVWGPDACREGQGTLTDTAGCQHVHFWSRNTRVGEGEEVYPNGVVLKGTWQDDAVQNGVYVSPNGDQYVGDVDAVRHVRAGTGTCTSADGLSVYTGGWADDKRSGHGVFVRYQSTNPAAPDSGARGSEAPASAHSTAGAGKEGGAPVTANLLTASTITNIAGSDPKVLVERYEGEWLDDVRCGAGHEEKGEEVYEGSFAADCRDGAGVQRNTRTGSFYNGQWKAGHRCGAGAYYSATKDTTYEGVFLHDRLTGAGTATKGGSLEQYSGLWLDGVEQGHGSLRLANGDTLRGVWHRGRPEPDATVEYVDAAERGAVRDSRYVGGWRDGARHGIGTQVFRDGSVYEGAWVDNKQHGRGRRTAASGESVECEWVCGGIAPGCVASVRFADGSVYAGQVNAAGVPHGAGVLTYPDGTVFDGHFNDGIYQL